MSRFAQLTALVFIAGLMAACAQQEEPAPPPAPVIEAEPTFSKV